MKLEQNSLEMPEYRKVGSEMGSSLWERPLQCLSLGTGTCSGSRRRMGYYWMMMLVAAHRCKKMHCIHRKTFVSSVGREEHSQKMMIEERSD